MIKNMQMYRLITSSIFLIALLAAATTPNVAHAGDQLPDYLTELGKADVIDIDKIEEEIKSRAIPFISDVQSVDNKSQTTFFYFGDDCASNCEIVSHLTFLEKGIEKDPNLNAPMHRLFGSNIWYCTYDIPNDAISTYSYELTLNQSCQNSDSEGSTINIHDSLNAQTYKIGKQVESIIEMPEAPKQKWLGKQGSNPEGEWVEHTIPSAAQGKDKLVHLYIPPGYDSF